MGKPDFIIIGAMRSATSTLSSYLFEHPKIHIVEGKEVHFFSDEKIYNQGVDWYFSKFLNISEGEIVGEASPSYFATSIVPSRIKNLLPNVKIIFCARNPGERSISHFLRNKSMQLEQNSFEDMFSDDNIHEANHYIGNSMYAKSFYWWLHFFDPSQIAVVFFDEIINRPQNVMSELFDFLNVNPINFSNIIHNHPTHWQDDESHKYQDVLFKINKYCHDDILSFLQNLQNSGVKIIGEPESINFCFNTPENSEAIMDKKQMLLDMNMIEKIRSDMATIDCHSHTTIKYQDDVLNLLQSEADSIACDVIEVGCYLGGLTTQLSYACATLGKRLHIVDINIQYLNNTLHHMDRLGVGKNVLCFTGDLETFLSTVRFEHSPLLIVIDGDPTYNAVIKDVNAVLKYQPQTKHLVFHNFSLRYIQPELANIRVDKAIQDALGILRPILPFGTEITEDAPLATSPASNGHFHELGTHEGAHIRLKL